MNTMRPLEYLFMLLFLTGLAVSVLGLGWRLYQKLGLLT